MYSRFFGFKERPFKLLPDPTYLFLGKSHEEALAHLRYTVEHGDGFVEITGEVGTGKTTLCRVFLDRLREDTEAAYIFNPKLDAIQLLKAINDEFGIDASADNTKDLIDRLNIFLMQEKAAGKNVILIIDEAQNLSIEVLEQLRLLSNLETTRSKLLQIILVGQPELADMLDSHELRQLGQRVTLSCHLMPLTFGETVAYIQHRLQVALTKPGHLFTRSAFKEIYKYAGGIPRLINIVCDRSLLIAYSRNQKSVTVNTVRMAIRELASRGDLRRRFSLRLRTTAGLLIGAVVVMSVLMLPGIVHKDAGINPPTQLPPDVSVLKDKDTATAPSSPTQKPLPSTPIQSDSPEVKEPVALNAFLGQPDSSATRYHALEDLLAMWGIESHVQPFLESIEDDRTYFSLVTRQFGLNIQAVDGDATLIRKLNLPAIFKFKAAGDRPPTYLTLEAIDESQASFKVNGMENPVTFSFDALAKQFKGTAFVAWKNYLGFEGTIPLNHPKGAIIMLKMLLREIGYKDVDIDPVYNERTRGIIRDIQKKHGIEPDGFVGPLTKIVLYNEKENLSAPRLVSYTFPEKDNEN